jgi:GxxExxY protein
MLHEQLTSKILEACFEVSNELGSGFLESVYEQSLIIALKEKDIFAESQVPLKITFRGRIVGNFVADFVVNQKVLLELKAVKGLLPELQAQVINYLHAIGLDVGLLINFGKPKIEYKRLFRRNRE